MAWKVAGPNGRYFAYDGKAWDADSETQVDALLDVGKPVAMTPTGPVYEPTGPDDEVGLYLLALDTVPGPVTITGDVPTVPEVAYPTPEGAVF